MDIQEILRGYKAGEISLEIAEAKIRQIDERPGTGYTNMGFARLDTQRKERSGFPEVIFCWRAGRSARGPRRTRRRWYKRLSRRRSMIRCPES